MTAFLRAGRVAERKRVTFEFRTDSPSRPTRKLSVRARFVPESEVFAPSVVEASGDPATRGTQSIRVDCRRKAGEGLRGPSEIAATGPFRVDDSKSGIEVERSDGIIEVTKELVISRISGLGEGSHRGEITLRWPDGSSRAHEVRWEVAPSLRAFAAGPGRQILGRPVRADEYWLPVRGMFRGFQLDKEVYDRPISERTTALVAGSVRLNIDMPDALIPLRRDSALPLPGELEKPRKTNGGDLRRRVMDRADLTASEQWTGVVLAPSRVDWPRAAAFGVPVIAGSAWLLTRAGAWRGQRGVVGSAGHR